MKRLIYGVLFLAILMFAISFTVKNTGEDVKIVYYLGFEWAGPLSMLLFSVLGIGVILGILFTFTWVIKAKRKIALSQREVKKMEREVANLRTLPAKDLE